MSIIVTLATAVVDQLNGGSFGDAFTAVLAWTPLEDRKLEKLSGLSVIVVPGKMGSAPFDRATEQHTPAVHVAVQKRVANDAEVPELLDLVERVRACLSAEPPAGAPWARWTGVEIDPIYVPDHLDRMKVFTSVIRASYKAVTER